MSDIHRESNKKRDTDRIVKIRTAFTSAAVTTGQTNLKKFGECAGEFK